MPTIFHFSHAHSAHWATLGLAIAALSSAPTAAAEPAAAAGQNHTETFELCDKKIKDLRAQKEYEKAAAEGLKCWRVTTNFVFLFGAAQNWQDAGHHAHAIDTLKQYQIENELRQDKPERIRLAKKLLDEELKYAGKVSLEFKPELEPDLNFTLVATFQPGDDTKTHPPLEFIATAEKPVEIYLDPGTWDLKFTGKGYQESKQIVTVMPDRAPQTSLVKVIIIPSDEHVPVIKPTITLKSASFVVKPWKSLAIGGGLALAASATMLVVTGVFAARANSEASNYENAHCVKTYSRDCRRWYDNVDRAKNVQIAGLVSAPLLLGAGVAMLVVALRGNFHKRPRVAPVLTPHMVGLTWRQSF